MAYNLTTEMQSIWGTNGSVLTLFTSDFANKSASVLTVLGTIRDGVVKMAGISDKEADKDLKDTDGAGGKNPGNNDTIDEGPLETLSNHYTDIQAVMNGDKNAQFVDIDESMIATVKRRKLLKNKSAVQIDYN